MRCMMSAYQETKVHGTHSFPYAVYTGLVPDWLSSFPLHWHEETEIIYVQEGCICVSIQNTEYTVHRGEIVLIHPQTIHAIKQHGDSDGLYFNILFRLSMLESGADDLCREKYFEPIYSRKLLMPEYISLYHPLNQQLAPVIESMLHDPKNRSFRSELIIKAKLFKIIYDILGYCEASDKNQVYSDIIFDKLKISLRHLEEHYAENITVETLASLSNYSVSHFSKLFKQLTGESLTQYLKNYRLETAADRLLNEDTRVSEIAVSCGFSNLSYFSRAFYHKFKVSPSDFRKKRNSH